MYEIRLRLTLIILLFIQTTVNAENKNLQAVRTEQAPKIDGVLDDPVWQNAPIASSFIQNNPVPGTVEKNPTEVRVLYDDLALYVAAVMYEISADSIFRELGKRDTEGNTDLFGIQLDTYNDKLNAYGFYVTPAGVQLDARYSPSGKDSRWNAVWESKTTITQKGWIVEMKIPYSAIRFSGTPEQTWGLNFLRKVKRNNETYYWNPVDPAVQGLINQFGQMTGIEKIKSPMRLSFSPYISAYVEHGPQNNSGKKSTTSRLNGGMDVKYGINESFTLDMTLVPDFGQVQSDNQVLNLSPFEVQFGENRPFFMEGTELFNKGGFFYSRRIGSTPINRGNVGDQLKPSEEIKDNPIETSMLNATKVSGRTRNGTGIGLLNSTTANTYAIVQDEHENERKILTQPLSNYNVFVMDQSLKNNSYVTLVNTNVMRHGALYDANLTGGLFKLVNKRNTYAVSGKAALSQLYHPGEKGPDLGHTYNLNLSKTSGNFRFSMNHHVESHTYNPNDLGILQNNNEVTEKLGLYYNIYKPFGRFLSLRSNLYTEYSRLYLPNHFQYLRMYGNINTTTRDFTTFGVDFMGEPIKGYNFFEARTKGRYYVTPESIRVGGFVSTDYRKKFALDVNARYRDFNENKRRSVAFTVAPRFRASNQLSFYFNFNKAADRDNIGFVSSGASKESLADTIIFGRRKIDTFTNTLSGSYIFTNRMSVSLRTRHYWSTVKYLDFLSLEPDGSLSDHSYTGNHDTNFNAFNIDMVYSWWFAPGSEVSIVWKNAVLTKESELSSGYIDSLQHTLQSPQNNSLSVKVLYFLDYQSIKKKA
jgi:hypothetical protein